MITIQAMEHEYLSHSNLIDRLGGTAKVAEMFSVSPQAVSKWRARGIPNSRLMYLRLAAPNIFVDSTPAQKGQLRKNEEST